MLANAAIVEAVAAAVEDLEIPLLVVDPVMIAKSGDRLLDDEALAAMKSELLRRAFVVTPNIPEAEALSRDRRSAPTRTAARRRGASLALGAVGGDHQGRPPAVARHRRPALRRPPVHGVPRRARRRDAARTAPGARLPRPLTAHLALGRTLEDAIPLAQEYVAGAIAHAPGLGTGTGRWIISGERRGDRPDRDRLARRRYT